jgi:ATP-dependent RNA helicase SUPV3L1/SUV3
MEVFYTFAWGSRAAAKQVGRGGDRNGGQNRNANKTRKGGKPNAVKSGDKQRAQKFSAKPEKKNKIDPDNPFAAALMGLNKG